jgi:glycosyltransferase involved in cell wall biosynthesis
MNIYNKNMFSNGCEFGLVSIIIPTWNRREQVIKAINSALNQNYKNIEILVCDDGSVDGTREAVESLTDSRIRWIAGRRGGRPAIPRNNGIRAARGVWLAFLDSDDLWHATKLEIQLRYLSTSNFVSISSSTAVLISKNFPPIDADFRRPKHINILPLLKSNFIVTSSVIFSKHHQLQAGLFPESKLLAAYEDYAYWLRFSLLGEVAFFESPLVKYNDESADSIRRITKSDALKQFYVSINFLCWVLMNKPIKLFFIVRFYLINFLKFFLIKLYRNIKCCTQL